MIIEKLLKFLFALSIAATLFAGLARAEDQAHKDNMSDGAEQESPQDLLEKQFKKIDELIALGTPGLALRIAEQNQPEFNRVNLGNWMLWEQKKILLLEYLEKWQRIVDRITEFEKPLINFTVATADRNWFLTQRAKANLQLNNNRVALQQLQKMLWNINRYVNSEVIAQWRRLVIRAYMNMELLEDAQRAMRRYRQDYGDEGGKDGMQWKLLQAQLLMRTGRHKQAVYLLENNDSITASALKMLARLQANAGSSAGIKEQLVKKLAEPETGETEQRIYWYVLLHVAMAEQDMPGQIDAIEQLLSLQGIHQLKSVFFDVDKYVSADVLWAMYRQNGEALANQYRLLRGNDEAWYIQASNLFETRPLQARSLFGVLSFSAQQERHRYLSMNQLVKLLEKQEAGLNIINQLFLHSEQIKNIEHVSAEVRYRLVDFALSRADLKSAARLMENLPQPPQGEDTFAWSLRRARVLILGGQYQEGEQVMRSLIQPEAPLEDAQIDQYMQVVFDLQNVEQHERALALFGQIEQLELSGKLKREITFWKAESYQARGDRGKGDYEQAAFLFLKSARPLDNVIDPWFHTSSFRAAESLAEAGLIEDARRQYLKLLRFTSNTARKAVIQQRLQQLRLKQGQQTDAPVAETAAR